ncbi:YtfP isoform A [Senna tora]|uniref:YtfP isoform A n=1 Tax=Senna tora TaxID=362788 RepID=A0A834VZ76_9FABA|nr:YtfP isoform A [Senna tora]
MDNTGPNNSVESSSVQSRSTRSAVQSSTNEAQASQQQHHMRQLRVLFESEQVYTLDLLKKFKMADCAPVSTLMITGKQYSKLEGSPIKDPTLYRQAVGSLQHLVTTRPDIAYSSREELLVVVGGGAAGVYGAIQAKTVAPNLSVVIIEKGKPLSKVKVSGGGRCNVTNGHCSDNMILAENYPRGHKELRGSFFNSHGPEDTMSWFSSHGVELKTRKVVTSVSVATGGKFLLNVKQLSAAYVEHVEADYLLIASGCSRQGYTLASQLGHTIVDPVPSLFTFKIEDLRLTELSGVSFPKVKVRLKLDNVQRNIPQLTQVGSMLVTHWGLSGPAILRLSAWGARYLFSSGYRGKLFVDFTPDLHEENVKSMLSQHKQKFPKQKVLNSYPPEFGISRRFWTYMLDRQGLGEEILWASISNNSLISIASVLKHCTFEVTGKGQFKDEFVTAGGVPLSEISLKTMESKICPNLFFAGEVLNVDGVTGGFNFQNAWSGGFIAGTTIGRRALSTCLQRQRILEHPG